MLNWSRGYHNLQETAALRLQLLPRLQARPSKLLPLLLPLGATLVLQPPLLQVEAVLPPLLPLQVVAMPGLQLQLPLVSYRFCHIVLYQHL